MAVRTAPVSHLNIPMRRSYSFFAWFSGVTDGGVCAGAGCSGWTGGMDIGHLTVVLSDSGVNMELVRCPADYFV